MNLGWLTVRPMLLGGSLIGAALIGTSSVGCGGPAGLPNMVPIRGTVSYEGKMLTEGTVIFAPTASDGRQARGTIQSDGSFRLTTLKQNDGAQQGEYKIVVIALEPHPGEPPSREEVEAAGGLIKRGYVVPERYTSAGTTDLTELVNDNHSGVTTIELTD